jgi:hypothetical protein
MDELDKTGERESNVAAFIDTVNHKGLLGCVCC